MKPSIKLIQITNKLVLDKLVLVNKLKNQRDKMSSVQPLFSKLNGTRPNSAQPL